MKHRSKLLLLITISALAVFSLLLFSCNEEKGEDKYSIVCTIFPEYDFINEILGDNGDSFEVIMLTSNGSDMHSYQPTIADLAKISECDLLVYVGQDSQSWSKNILKNVNTEKTKVISLAELFEDSLCHDTHGSDQDHEHGFDEHLWLSLKKSQIIVEELCKSICEIDPQNKEAYQSNAKSYTDELKKLDEEFVKATQNAPHNTLIFADRFPFVYLLEDYGIDHYAAFESCSTETDAGVKTVLMLAERLKSLNLPAVMITENCDKAIANTVISESGMTQTEILVLNSCQTVTKQQMEDGVHYIDVMRSNLNNIKKALGCQE